MNEFEYKLLLAARAVRDNNTTAYQANPTPVDDVITQFEAIENTFEELVKIKLYDEVFTNNALTSTAQTYLALITTASFLRQIVRELTQYATLNFNASDLEDLLDEFEQLTF